LFTYYKSYRANVRAKVNSLRARSAAEPAARRSALGACGNYLRLMDSYLGRLEPPAGG
jgi:aminoglycoside phosphotransferase family enzyme